jgi:hypothetical protein
MIAVAIVFRSVELAERGVDLHALYRAQGRRA